MLTHAPRHPGRHAPERVVAFPGMRIWVATVFSKNRDRLLEAEVARKFLVALLNHKEVRALLSDEHFSVDGTQIAAWASMKSFAAKDGSDEPPSPGRNGERDFHGQKRSNETHASTPTRRRSSIARAKARRQNSPTSATP